MSGDKRSGGISAPPMRLFLIAGACVCFLTGKATERCAHPARVNARAADGSKWRYRRLSIEADRSHGRRFAKQRFQPLTGRSPAARRSPQARRCALLEQLRAHSRVASSAARRRSMSSGALRLASILMWLYGLSIWRDTWPAISVIVSSQAPDLEISVISE